MRRRVVTESGEEPPVEDYLKVIPDAIWVDSSFLVLSKTNWLLMCIWNTE